MDSEIFLVIAATVIALSAIYFFFVRKPNTQAKQFQPAHDPRDPQQ